MTSRKQVLCVSGGRGHADLYLKRSTMGKVDTEVKLYFFRLYVR